MRRTIALGALLLAAPSTSGCSLVYDPDDHVEAANPCDRDRDGHYAATVECGGEDCDDDDGGRYPGATPRCDGAAPADCNAPALQPQLRSIFGVDATVGVDYGRLPYHTDGTLPVPGPAFAALPLAVRIVGFETDDGGQASVAFIGGDSTVDHEPQVYLYNYGLLAPAEGRVDDPALGSPTAFDLGGLDGNSARVLATQRGFTGVGPFLLYRDVVAGVDRPELSVNSTSSLGGNTAGTLVRATVALAGAYAPTRDAALSPQMMWVERSQAGGGDDHWGRLPFDDTSTGAYRYVPLTASLTTATRLWSTTGPQVFAVDDSTPAPTVWSRAADSGSPTVASGVTGSYAMLPSGGMASVEPSVISVGAPDFDGAAAYAAFYVDSGGQPRVHAFGCADVGTGASRASGCVMVADVGLTVPGVEVTALAAAPTPGAGAVLALVARVVGTNLSGVLLYYLDGANPPSAIPFAPVDGMNRPWLVRPEESNGHFFERIAVTLLDHAQGSQQRWTVAVAGVSDYRVRSGVEVTMTGVVACIP